MFADNINSWRDQEKKMRNTIKFVYHVLLHRFLKHGRPKKTATLNVSMDFVQTEGWLFWELFLENCLGLSLDEFGQYVNSENIFYSKYEKNL